MSARRSARNIKVSELIANPANIRTNVGDVTELARSIREQGILNPLLVTEDPKFRGWLLLAGHRRLAAAQLAEVLAVPCFIHHDVGGDHVEQTVVMLVENVQRKNLTPVEKAKAYGSLRDRGLTPSQIARRTGIHVSTIHTHLALLDLDDQSLEAVEDGDLNAGDAIAAVREHRKKARSANGQPVRGRPVVHERPHFTKQHPFAALAALACEHSTRPKLGYGACGQCWEEVIRADERGEVERPGNTEQPTPNTEHFDEAVVDRRLGGDHSVPLRRPDTEEIVRRGHSAGLNDQEIARRSGLTDRTVLRVRQDLGLPSDYPSAPANHGKGYTSRPTQEAS